MAFGILFAHQSGMLTTLLYVAAFVLFLLAGIGVPDAPRARLGWLGAACAMLAYLVGNWPGH